MSKFSINKPVKKKSFIPWLWFFALLPFLLLFIAGIIAYTLYNQNLKPLSSETNPIVVTIEPGLSAPQIGDLLENEGVIRSGWVFDIYTRLNGHRDDLKAGGYKLSPSLSVPEVVDKLVSGEVATDLVTLLPGKRLDELKADMVKAGYSRDEVNNAFKLSNFEVHPINKYIPANSNLEGYLYPESFQKTATTDLTEVLTQSLDLMYDKLTPVLRNAFAEHGLTAHQAVIMASIVEREVSKPEDRTKVAQVFIKRYKEGIPLGSDPTALYGALLAGADPTVFVDTPYNTRLYAGLPPGPINNVTEESLLAVAYPADTDYLFFVSGDDGNTYFSYTQEEHEQLTAQYCIELCVSY